MVAECGPDLSRHHRLFKSHLNSNPHRRRLWTHHRRTLVDPGRLYPEARPRVHIRRTETLAPLDRGVPRRAAGSSHRGLSCHRGYLGPVASAAVVHAGRWKGDDPVSCVRSPRRAPLVLAVGALSRGRVRLLLLPSPCVGEHANRGAFAFKHFTRDGRGARPHGALVGRFPPQAPNRRGLRRKTGMVCSVN